MLEGVSSLPIFDLSLFSGLQSINSSSPISRSEIVIELELALVLGSLFRRGDKTLIFRSLLPDLPDCRLFARRPSSWIEHDNDDDNESDWRAGTN